MRQQLLLAVCMAVQWWCGEGDHGGRCAASHDCRPPPHGPWLHPAALLSRQFVDTSRIRIEGLLAAFPKLIGGAADAGKQHTFVETDNVRCVASVVEVPASR
jgi:hypothetical protein